MHFGKHTLHLDAGALVCTLGDSLVATTAIGKIARLALWISPIIMVIAAGFPVLGWATRNQHPYLVEGVAIGVPFFVMVYAVALARRVERVRPLDEVQLA